MSTGLEATTGHPDEKDRNAGRSPGDSMHFSPPHAVFVIRAAMRRAFLALSIVAVVACTGAPPPEPAAVSTDLSAAPAKSATSAPVVAESVSAAVSSAPVPGAGP